MKKEAVISKCELYRYSLSRIWDENKKQCMFIMLNPSKADANIDDSTITRCINIAKINHFGSIKVVNLFAYRTSYPSELFEVKDPIGPENNIYLKRNIKESNFIIVAWGNCGSFMSQDVYVKRLCEKYEKKMNCFKITNENQPHHPRGIPYNKKLILYF